jgi:hypothetical protein
VAELIARVKYRANGTMAKFHILVYALNEHLLN